MGFSITGVNMIMACVGIYITVCTFLENWVVVTSLTTINLEFYRCEPQKQTDVMNLILPPLYYLAKLLFMVINIS